MLLGYRYPPLASSLPRLGSPVHRNEAHLRFSMVKSGGMKCHHFQREISFWRWEKQSAIEEEPWTGEMACRQPNSTTWIKRGEETRAPQSGKSSFWCPKWELTPTYYNLWHLNSQQAQWQWGAVVQKQDLGSTSADLSLDLATSQLFNGAN